VSIKTHQAKRHRQRAWHNIARRSGNASWRRYGRIISVKHQTRQQNSGKIRRRNIRKKASKLPAGSEEYRYQSSKGNQRKSASYQAAKSKI